MIIKEEKNIFDGDNIFDILEQEHSYRNVNWCGHEADELSSKMQELVNKQNIDEDTKFCLCDGYTDVSALASTYGYRQGFADCARLLRNIMKL